MSIYKNNTIQQFEEFKNQQNDSEEREIKREYIKELGHFLIDYAERLEEFSDMSAESIEKRTALFYDFNEAMRSCDIVNKNN